MADDHIDVDDEVAIRPSTRSRSRRGAKRAARPEPTSSASSASSDAPPQRSMSDDMTVDVSAARPRKSGKRQRQKELSRRQTINPEKEPKASRKSVSFDLAATTSADSDAGACAGCAELQQQSSGFLQQLEALQLRCEQQAAQIEDLEGQLAVAAHGGGGGGGRRAGKAAVPVAPPPPPAIGKSILAPRTNRSVAASLPFNASMLQQGMAGLHRTGRDSQGSGRKGSARKRGRKSVGEWAAAVFSLKPPHCLAAT